MKIKKYSLVLLFFILANSSLSFAEHDQSSFRQRGTDSIGFNGKYFPRQINLSSQFPENEKSQFGGTCHIFAATGLFEAACFKKTGKRINLSESYLYLRHLRSMLSKTDGYSYDNALNALLSGNVTTIDGALIEEAQYSLQRIINQSIIEERRNEQSIHELMDKFSILILLRTAVKNDPSYIKNFLIESIDKLIQKGGGKPAKSGGYTLSPDTDNLKKCFEHKWKVVNTPYNLEKAMALLSRGTPFACAGNYNAEKKEISSRDSNHIAIVNGYRFNTAYSNNMEFNVRNAYGNQLSQTGWYIKDCAVMLYLEEVK